jgi:hypothetical protein
LVRLLTAGQEVASIALLKRRNRELGLELEGEGCHPFSDFEVSLLG